MPFKAFNTRFCSSLSSNDDEVGGLPLKWAVLQILPTTVPMEQRKRKLSEAVLVLSTDVRVFLERVRGEKKPESGIVHCWKRFLKYTPHQPKHRLMFFEIKVAERLFC